MKIVYISDARFPHSGADTLVIVHTVAALGAAGADVELVAPRLWRSHNSRRALCEHYGVAPTFTLTRLPSFPPKSATQLHIAILVP